MRYTHTHFQRACLTELRYFSAFEQVRMQGCSSPV